MSADLLEKRNATQCCLSDSLMAILGANRSLARLDIPRRMSTANKLFAPNLDKRLPVSSENKKYSFLLCFTFSKEREIKCVSHSGSERGLEGFFNRQFCFLVKMG